MSTLTPSYIIEHLYCPRFTFYERVANVPQYEEKLYKVQRGRELHDQKLEDNKPYLRRKLGVVEKWLNPYMCNEHLRGELDEALLLADGTMAPLDYKFAEWKDRVHLTTEIQLYCYAWLIESNFDKPVHKGFLVYTRSRNKVVEVPIPPDAKERVKQAAAEVLHIIETSQFPKGTRQKSKCATCTYRNICPQ
jgi:CRISPR-associated exonuclease Cas4